MNQLPDNSQPITEPSVIRTNRPRMAVFGEWNTTNLGDRAIFQGVQAFCRNAGWDVDAYGLGTLTPVALASIADHPLSAWNVPPNASRQTSPFVKQDGSLSYRLYQHAKQNARGVRQHYRMKRLLPRLNQANAILVGGGLLLSDRNLHFPQSLVAIARTAKKLQLPLLCLGCGAVEDWSPRGKEMITEFVEVCTLIAARDQETARKLSEILRTPVPVFGDFALSLPTVQEKSQCTQPTLAINVMGLVAQQPSDQERYESVLIEAVNRWVQQFDQHRDITVKVFTTGTCEDTQPAKRVAEQLTAPHVNFYVPESTDQLNQLLQNCTAVLASRLHAAILAISQGVPVVGVGAGHVSQKLYNFFKAIGIDSYSISTLDDDAASKILNKLKHQHLEEQNLCINLPEIAAIRADVNTVLRKQVILEDI